MAIKSELYNIKSHETLNIGIILSLVGGILDAHTFLFRNGIFANTQTGNIVLLALLTNTENKNRVILCIFSIIAFVIGIALTEFIKIKLKKNQIVNYICIILSIEIFFLSILAVIPQNVQDNTVITLISFVCSMQTNAFRTLKGSPYTTTMCTGNLRNASSNLFMYIYKKDRIQGFLCLRYFIIITSFFVGALLGKFFTAIIKEQTLLVCCLLLTIALLIILIKNKNINNRKTY